MSINKILLQSLLDLQKTVSGFCAFLPENVPPNRQKTHHLAHICGIKVVINRLLLDTHDALLVLEGGHIAERKKINTHPGAYSWWGQVEGRKGDVHKWLNEMVIRIIQLIYIYFLFEWIVNSSFCPSLCFSVPFSSSWIHPIPNILFFP